MLISVILHGTRVLRDRYRHFVRVRRDLKLAVNNHKLNVREVRVGVLEVFRFNAYRIFANVRSLGRPRFGRRFLHAGRHVIQRVVSRHALVASNRMFLAVIRHGVRVLRDRHNHFVRDRRDLQRSVDRLRNDILSCSVNRALGSVREDSVIRSDIRSLRTNCDIAEISLCRRSGKAGNALLRSIISLLVAVRRQLDVLMIVEIDLVRSRPNRDRLLVIRYWRVARNRDGGFRHSLAELRSSIYRIINTNLCSVQIIVYRVSGCVLFIVERQLALVFCEIDGLLLRMTFYKIERIEIFLQGIRRCNIFGSLPHKACLFIRSNQFFSIIIDIFDRINGRKLLNINRSVHVPCIRSRLHIIIRAIVNIEFRPCNLV